MSGKNREGHKTGMVAVRQSTPVNDPINPTSACVFHLARVAQGRSRRARELALPADGAERQSVGAGDGARRAVGARRQAVDAGVLAGLCVCVWQGKQQNMRQ